jgi:uncharacterized protein
MGSSVGVAVFAKAPIEGFAKTRLIPVLGAKRAAALQRDLIEGSVEVAIQSQLGPVSVWCTPNCEHEVFTRLAEIYPVQLYKSEPHLGASLLRAFEALTTARPLLIIGTDCPLLASSHLIECALALRRGADAVFLPTEDGGYALVGSQRPIPALFCDMPWSTDQVMAETRRRARQIGLTIAEPAVLWDIDTPANYSRALTEGLLKADNRDPSACC